jgi:hypothetical protein
MAKVAGMKLSGLWTVTGCIGTSCTKFMINGLAPDRILPSGTL